MKSTLPRLFLPAALLFPVLSGCIALPPVSDETCAKMLSSRDAYLQCLEKKSAAACEHLLRLYQADVQVFVAAGCAANKPATHGLRQMPTW